MSPHYIGRICPLQQLASYSGNGHVYVDTSGMEFFRRLLYLFRHLNETRAWNSMIDYIGQTNIYVLLFAIIFAETGLVVTPFLPGDSLLFAVGAIGARPEINLNLPVLTVLLI